jgi:ubiquinone/menaquinone biosynthesis C-methylase UbiE
VLDYTGERMVPEAADGRTFWEHVERYRYARANLNGSRILDVACGEGYGTAALATDSSLQVVGVDISPESCEHARNKYGVDARIGCAEAIPLPDASIDTVVSFETIEHLKHPEAFLAECYRILSPGGRLVISTPNRPVYHRHTPNNAFHHHEMTLGEFQESLSERFRISSISGQCVPLPSLLQMRGIRKLPAVFYRLVTPHSSRPPLDEERMNVKDLILRPSCWQDRIDPYSVRPMSVSRLQSACYLIAIATRKSN